VGPFVSLALAALRPGRHIQTVRNSEGNIAFVALTSVPPLPFAHSRLIVEPERFRRVSSASTRPRSSSSAPLWRSAVGHAPWAR